MNKSKYFAYTQTEKEANINIYGDITSWEWIDSDVSSYTLAKVLDSLPETIEKINVFINSYGGEVAEGLAIYNALKRHKAKIVTYCDGFACSIASVIFMAGDERIMSNASLLMIHNAWTYAQGNANDLRKQAEDLDTITQASINAYMNKVNITEEELKELLDSEKWMECNEALEKGFITSIINDSSDKISQSAKKELFKAIMNYKAKKDTDKTSQKEEKSQKEDTKEESETEDKKKTEQEEQKKEQVQENKQMACFFNLLKILGGK